MQVYKELIKNILDNGYDHIDRTGVGRRTVFCRQLRFDLSNGKFPLVTTRKIFTKAFIYEMLWFIKGSVDVSELQQNGVTIWDNWALDEKTINNLFNTDKVKELLNEESIEAVKNHYINSKINTIGKLYGYNWRNAPVEEVHMLSPDISLDDIPSDKLDIYKKEYEEDKEAYAIQSGTSNFYSLEEYCKLKYYSTVDQLNNLVLGLKKNPFSSRHIVSAWIPSLIPFDEFSPKENIIMERGSLAPCHMMFQCMVAPAKEEGGKLRLSLGVYIRSSDTAIGLPYNIAQYALLQYMLAQVVDMDVNELVVNTGDSHLYLNHLDLVKEQLSREPLPLPTIKLNPDVKDLFDFKFEDISIVDYSCHPKIDYPIAI